MVNLAVGMEGARRVARPTARLVLDALLPPRCLGCDALVEEPGSLCAGCWQGIDFLTPPCCAACGYPFEYALPEEALCAACLWRRPAYDRARAVFRYGEASRGLILGFKHGDRTHAAPAFARWLARAGAEALAAADLIDSRFDARILGLCTVGGKAAIRPSLTGRAWITGLHHYSLDPTDPFPEGYTLSDTWYRVV